MSARIDLTGKRFGRWVVGEFRGANANKQTIYWCRCDCGAGREVVAQTLRAGLTLSCGCMKGQAIAATSTRHGHTRVKSTGQKDSRTYDIWQAMHNRCRGKTESGREYYVRHGIAVCERWNSFENFLADMGEAPDGLSIDRFPDEEGNYEPGNCRWATGEQQANNKRAYRVRVHMDGETHKVSREVAETLLENGWKIVPRHRQRFYVSDAPGHPESA